MNFNYRRSYTGPIEAVLLDWAGTTMDFGCMAPAVVFVEVFKRQKVPITTEEARAPMGAHKRVHIQRISELDSVRRRWQETHGRPPNDNDVSAMFTEFVPLRSRVPFKYSATHPGDAGRKKAIAQLRSRGIKVGSTTGYLTEMMNMPSADAKRGAERGRDGLRGRRRDQPPVSLHVPAERNQARREHGAGCVFVKDRRHGPGRRGEFECRHGPIDCP